MNKMDSSKIEIVKSQMTISCAFAGLCFAILSLINKGGLNSHGILISLWLAVITFACSGLRSADRLLDTLSSVTPE